MKLLNYISEFFSFVFDFIKFWFSLITFDKESDDIYVIHLPERYKKDVMFRFMARNFFSKEESTFPSSRAFSDDRLPGLATIFFVVSLYSSNNTIVIVSKDLNEELYGSRMMQDAFMYFIRNAVTAKLIIAVEDASKLTQDYPLGRLFRATSIEYPDKVKVLQFPKRPFDVKEMAIVDSHGWRFSGNVSVAGFNGDTFDKIKPKINEFIENSVPVNFDILNGLTEPLPTINNTVVYVDFSKGKLND